MGVHLVEATEPIREPQGIHDLILPLSRAARGMKKGRREGIAAAGIVSLDFQGRVTSMTIGCPGFTSIRTGV
jgi:hypothetical protein